MIEADATPRRVYAPVNESIVRPLMRGEPIGRALRVETAPAPLRVHLQLMNVPASDPPPQFLPYVIGERRQRTVALVSALRCDMSC